MLTLTTLAARDTVAASSYTTVMDHAAQAFEVPGTPILAVGVMRSFVLAVLAWRSRTGQRACGVPRQAFGGTSASRGARNAAGRSGCPPSQCLSFSDRAPGAPPAAEALSGAWTPQRSGLRAANRAPLWRGSGPAGWIGHCPARRGDDCLSSHQEDGTRPAVRWSGAWRRERRDMGQTARFQEILRRLAVIDEGFRRRRGRTRAWPGQDIGPGSQDRGTAASGHVGGHRVTGGVPGTEHQPGAGYARDRGRDRGRAAGDRPVPGSAGAPAPPADTASAA